MLKEIQPLVAELKNDFKEYANLCEGILLFGSYAKKELTMRSDIDICLIKSSKELLITLYKKFNGKYDIKIFELLPLYVKMDIINHSITIYGDEVELSEYFYFFRRLWKDMHHRIEQNQFQNFEERMGYRRKWLNEKEKILREIGNV